MREVIINGAELTDRREMHAQFFNLLEFPDYYGRNLDALFDCLTEMATDTTLTVNNAAVMREYLGEYTDRLKRVLDIAESYNEHFTLIWNE